MEKILVIMVHGFTGGEETWKNKNNISLKKLLLNNHQIAKYYDIVEYSYFTKIINFKNNIAAKSTVNILNKIPGVNIGRPKIKKNVSIFDLADELLTYIKYQADTYDEIVFICHSMGGLIAKKLVLDVIEREANLEKDVAGYITLATPHKGALSAILLSPININSKELGPLSKEVNMLNDKWVDQYDLLPESLYIIAKNDECVSPISAAPNENKKKFHCERVDEDHTSICKPVDNKATIYKILEKKLLKIAQKRQLSALSAVPFSVHKTDYDKEIFVIKLLLAKVNKALIDDAKESYFMTDIILKKAPQKDRKHFEDLSNRVVSLYKTFSAYTPNKSANEVVQEIHQQIIIHDRTALESVLDYVNFIHKKGFLHQEANKYNLNINWDNNVTIENILSEIEK